MEKVLQEPFWAPIPFKQYQNTSGCGTADCNFLFHVKVEISDHAVK